MTIVNHSTGQQITARALRLQYPSVCAEGNPLLGQPGYRTAWADSDRPTDAELRLIGHSLVVEVEKPTPGDGEQVRAGPLEKVEDTWRQTWIVEPIPVVVPEKVESFKVKQRLEELGLLSTVEAMINQSSNLTQLAWSAPYFHRASVLIGQFAVALGISPTELDAIFISSYNIET